MKRHIPRRYAAADLLRHLWAAHPSERDALRPYVVRAKSYKNECGCAMGGFFAIAALVALIVHGEFSLNHWLLDTVVVTAGVLGATFIGKTTGIGIARFRLVLLGLELRGRYGLRKE